MERRGFLRMMVGGVAAGAAVRTFPFRVFSFPSAPIISPMFLAFDPAVHVWGDHLTPAMINDAAFGFGFSISADAHITNIIVGENFAEAYLRPMIAQFQMEHRINKLEEIDKYYSSVRLFNGSPLALKI